LIDNYILVITRLICSRRTTGTTVRTEGIKCNQFA